MRLRIGAVLQSLTGCAGWAWSNEQTVVEHILHTPTHNPCHPCRRFRRTRGTVPSTTMPFQDPNTACVSSRIGGLCRQIGRYQADDQDIRPEPGRQFPCTKYRPAISLAANTAIQKRISIYFSERPAMSHRHPPDRRNIGVPTASMRLSDSGCFAVALNPFARTVTGRRSPFSPCFNGSVSIRNTDQGRGAVDDGL